MSVNWAVDSSCFVEFPWLEEKVLASSCRIVSSCDGFESASLKAILFNNYGKLSLRLLNDKAAGIICVEFESEKNKYRLKQGSIKAEMVAKAVGVKPNKVLNIIDATAGLGRDGFVLASLGCRVTMLERSILVAALVEDGLNRVQYDVDFQNIANRLSLVRVDAINYLASVNFSSTGERLSEVDVVYLDPMFPSSKKSAQVKKEMRIFREIMGSDLDGEKLLNTALESNVKRVVVKRPRKGAVLGIRKPSHSVVGTSSRFDVYLRTE